MNYRVLGKTGWKVSALSFGASSLGGVFGPVDDAAALATVRAALDAGINFLDVAPYYGATRAETALGKTLRGVARDRYYLATKIGQYGQGEFDFSAARTERSLDESCRRLGVDHIDLLQCHDIEFADLDQVVNETLPALVKLRERGRIGRIGITGLPLKVFTSVLDRVGPGVVDTVLSFCRYTLNDQALAGLLPYLHGKGVGVINAAPTGMGLLTPRGVPAWHPAPPGMLAGGRTFVEFCSARGVDPVQLAIQFSVQHPGIATTVVGTANPEEMKRNSAAAETPIDFALMAEVLAVLEPIRNHNFTRGRPENRDPLVP